MSPINGSSLMSLLLALLPLAAVLLDFNSAALNVATDVDSAAYLLLQFPLLILLLLRAVPQLGCANSYLVDGESSSGSPLLKVFLRVNWSFLYPGYWRCVCCFVLLLLVSDMWNCTLFGCLFMVYVTPDFLF